MRISARAAAAWGAGIAAVAAIGSFGAGAASAEACTPPSVHGFVVTGLSANGIPCHEAQQHAVHTMKHGAPSGWSCSHRISGRHVSWWCHASDGSGHNYHFGYRVE